MCSWQRESRMRTERQGVKWVTGNNFLLWEGDGMEDEIYRSHEHCLIPGYGEQKPEMVTGGCWCTTNMHAHCTAHAWGQVNYRKFHHIVQQK